LIALSRFELTAGCPAPLFDRLRGPALRSPIEPEPDAENPRLLNEEALRASLRRALAELLNTRTPVAIDLLERRTRTTIDYGIPDLSVFPIGENEARTRLARHVLDAILAYEPRLSDPTIEIARAEGSGETLRLVVSGAMKLGLRRVPVTFSFALGARAEANGDSG
jgi:type VI secretion system lysozyme-like protein